MKNSLKPGTPEFEFVGELEDMAETKFKANLHGTGEAWEDALFAEYKAAGSPKPRKKWIAGRIKNEFKSMASRRPGWISRPVSGRFTRANPWCSSPRYRSKPPRKPKNKLTASVAYIFGLRDKGEHGEDIMVYHGQTLTKW